MSLLLERHSSNQYCASDERAVMEGGESPQQMGVSRNQQLAATPCTQGPLRFLQVLKFCTILCPNGASMNPNV